MTDLSNLVLTMYACTVCLPLHGSMVVSYVSDLLYTRGNSRSKYKVLTLYEAYEEETLV